MRISQIAWRKKTLAHYLRFNCTVINSCVPKNMCFCRRFSRMAIVNESLKC